MLYHILYKDSINDLNSQSIVLEAAHPRHLSEIISLRLPSALILNIATQDFVDYLSGRVKVTSEIEYLSSVVNINNAPKKNLYTQPSVLSKIKRFFVKN